MGDALDQAATNTDNAINGEPLKPFRRAADAIEASGLDYTILHPAWLTNEGTIDYELTARDEPFKGTSVLRKSIVYESHILCKYLQHHDAYKI